MDLVGATIWQLHAARQLRALGADPRLVGVDIDIGTGMPGERSGMISDSDGRAAARAASGGGTPGEGTQAPLTAPPPTTRPEKPAPSTSHAAEEPRQ